MLFDQLTADFLFKLTFSKISFMNTIRVLSGLIWVQNCLRKISAETLPYNVAD